MVQTYRNAAFNAGRGVFSGIALIYGLLWLVAARFSLEFDDGADILTSKEHVDFWDILEALGVAAMGGVLILGGVAVWIERLPLRRLLLAITFLALMLISSVWALNGLGVTSIWFG